MGKVCLTAKERQQVEGLVRRSPDGRLVRRGQALLWLDRGEGAGAVAARLGVTRQTVWHWKRRWQRNRNGSLERVLADGAKTGRPPAKRRQVTTLLPALLETSPRDLGYRPQAWTVSLLQRHVRKVEGIAVSYGTVRRALRGLGYRYKRPRYVLARRSPTWRQAKGGSSVGYATAPGR